MAGKAPITSSYDCILVIDRSSSGPGKASHGVAGTRWRSSALKWPITLAVIIANSVIVNSGFADPRADDRPEIFTVGAIEIIDPWAQSVIGEVHGAQIFFEFRNHGKAEDSLIAAHSSIADGPIIFRSTRDATVRHIDIPGGGEAFELNKNGYHIELTGANVPLTMGKRFPMTLRFERAGTINITVTSRFHSPQLARRIRAAAERGDVTALRELKE